MHGTTKSNIKPSTLEIFSQGVLAEDALCYDTIICAVPLLCRQGLNDFFVSINQHLTEHGRFEFRFEQAKAEILGRLFYCGFEIVQETQTANLCSVVAQKNKHVEQAPELHYGGFIRLKRIGQFGKEMNVVKLRTMYPYAEFLQDYMCKNYRLQDGGKINNDFRITPCGRVLRKYWIDELPMMGLLLIGKIKLVGVRPLSPSFFGLYSEKLQQKRIQFKPGLFPPFYADLPQTLDEIEASEWNYLQQCEKNGVFVTDFIYFWKIIYNIVFRKARSA